MILQLRKRHLRVWTVLLFLLPIGILTAWLSVQKSVPEKSLQPAPVSPLEILLKQAGNERFHLKLRSNASGEMLQLEIHNIAPLEYPSALVYILHNAETLAEGAEVQVPADAELLGRIQERGIYRFPITNSLRNKPFSILLYDIIHHQRIDLLKF